VDGSALLQGDSVVLKDVRITSGGGALAVRGGIQLEDFSRPILALDARADQFRAVDVRNFLTLVATGDIQLRGPVSGATLTGSLTANSGVLYFADLVNKRVIDLEDPAYADLLDTTLIRRENLGNKFQNRFMDSLRVEDLRVGIGSDVWLRSAEANIQLDGSVRLTVCDDRSLRSWIHSFGPLARVVAPARLVQDIFDEIEQDFWTDPCHFLRRACQAADYGSDELRA